MKKLAEIRQEKGYTQASLAAEVGITQVMLCNIENGKRMPSVKTAKKLGEMLGFNWSEIYEDDSDQPQKG